MHTCSIANCLEQDATEEDKMSNSTSTYFKGDYGQLNDALFTLNLKKRGRDVMVGKKTFD